ncbi:thymidine phosphorylase family protein [Aliiglaciecola sp. CAU 1673]|uniref:thymidine phosphorylase family protein n=1 Tax=Aliiglaciecola sp. CAU 1673 TaxID=3032595 RepID=UPI0023DBE06C|nr:thymidine phosphorylase family protein [Aliiglaciecola sp. CAU 1673]MDF2180217.1 thymidine phosphorylase family protein [Aliiglaciecola sp. CAU 1673]
MEQRIANRLKVVDMGINTHQEPVVYMRDDCHVCKSEGFSAASRVKLTIGKKELVATLNIVEKHVLAEGQVGLSRIAMERLSPAPLEEVEITHPDVVDSLSCVRKKVFGNALSEQELEEIILDISQHRYADIEIASFLSVCAGSRLNEAEIIGLTKAMVKAGKHLEWPEHKRVFDKHCIGGLPGNRTTPLVVSIVSAAGYIMPKSSSRSITSPAGTADTMEVLTRVRLALEDIQRVVKQTGACLTWGGAVNLSPADDLLIRIERALDLDGEGQLIASVLSKKIAIGSTDVLIDIPVGPTAKVRNLDDAQRLVSLFQNVGRACGINVRCIITDGTKPVGRGIGPALEAKDLLAVLQNQQDAPMDLRERALVLSAHLLDMASDCGFEAGLELATAILQRGGAYRQFMRIIDAQGGLKSIPNAHFQYNQATEKRGRIIAIDNRKLAKVAKLAGAPFGIGAGLQLHSNVGDSVVAGNLLFTLYSDSKGELEYALEYVQKNPDIFVIEEN